jgi:hypothetical protein
MVGEARVYVQGESLKTRATLPIEGFLTPRSPGRGNWVRILRLIICFATTFGCAAPNPSLGAGSERQAPSDANRTLKPVTIARGYDQEVASLNGGFIYFIREHWATSGEIFQRRLANGSEKSITDGNAVSVVRFGKYAGYLLVEKHRYRDGGGSYNCVFLFRPDGREQFPVTDARAKDAAIQQQLTNWGEASLCGVNRLLQYPSAEMAQRGKATGESDSLSYDTNKRAEKLIYDRALDQGADCMLGAAQLKLTMGERGRAAIAAYIRKACIPPLLMQTALTHVPQDKTMRLTETMVQTAIDVALVEGH